MKKIIRNGKNFLRFKIGDEFKAISGKGSFNKMLKEQLASTAYDYEKGFIYPIYSGSTIGTAINGYANEFNYSGKALKISKDGAGSGKTILIDGKSFNGSGSFYLVGDNVNEYFAEYFNKILPSFIQGSTIPHVYYRDFKESIIEIPENHAELSCLIRRANKYKQLSKQLSKQLKDYKDGILQYSQKNIEKYKVEGLTDSYISFKIGDEFKKISGRGKGMFSTLGATKEKTSTNVYPLLTNSTANNHFSGYVNSFNYSGKAIKWTEVGNAGKTRFINGEVHVGEGGNLLVNDIFANEFVSELLQKIIPKYTQGSTMRHAKWPYFKDAIIEIPTNHKELSKIISRINKWEELINCTTKKLEKQIEGILQITAKEAYNG